MKTFFSVLFGSIGVLLLFMGIAWIIQGNSFFMYKVFAPKYENVRRQVFENTQSFTEGKIQDLSKYYLEYQRDSSSSDKKALQNVIQSQFSYFDANKLNDNLTLKQFLINMRGF